MSKPARDAAVRIGPCAVVPVAAVLAGMLAAGCGEPAGRPLSAEAFYQEQRRPVPVEHPGQPVDRPGAIRYDDPRNDRTPAAPRPAEPISGVNDVVRQSVPPGMGTARAGGPPAATIPATRASAVPETPPATLPGGQYQVVGGIVADVNGTPIYATQVLSEIERTLAAGAKDKSPAEFRRFAEQRIGEQVTAQVQSQLLFAAAERMLEQQEKTQAELLTQAWRQQQITESGGSLELARQRAPEIAARADLPDNLSFDDLVQRMYRVNMIRVLMQKKVWPRVQVSAEDMRRYYRQNIDKFTEPSALKFRLIQSSVKAAGSRDAALDKIVKLRGEIEAGQIDFAKAAADPQYNDDPKLRQYAGELPGGGWVQKGSYRLENVEKELWDLKPGQITKPVDEGGAFYIAMLEDKKDGKVEPFESESVQGTIRTALSAEQVQAIRSEMLMDLARQASERMSPDMLNTALDMAMQQYPRWREGK